MVCRTLVRAHLASVWCDWRCCQLALACFQCWTREKSRYVSPPQLLWHHVSGFLSHCWWWWLELNWPLVLGRAGWEHVCARDSCWHQRKRQGRGETSHAALSAKALEKHWGLNYSRKQSAYTSTDLIFNSRAFNQADGCYFQVGWKCPA